MSPDGLTALMNEYLSAMTDIIERHGGYVDKYIGDSIVAMFGAPADDPDHAANAARAALECCTKLAELNRDSAMFREHPLAQRIGINSGEAVVGNFGSRRRFNYSVMSDAVNLASRLEGANKFYGTTIIASETTVAQAGDGFAWRELDAIRVKGRSQALKIYELLALAAELTEAQKAEAANYAEGLAHWRAREFEAAAAAFARSADTDRPAAFFAIAPVNWPRPRPPPTGTRCGRCRKNNASDQVQPSASTSLLVVVACRILEQVLDFRVAQKGLRILSRRKLDDDHALGLPVAFDRRGHDSLHDVFAGMSCDVCRDFGDVVPESGEIIHRQVEHQIRLHGVLTNDVQPPSEADAQASGGTDGPSGTMTPRASSACGRALASHAHGLLFASLTRGAALSVRISPVADALRASLADAGTVHSVAAMATKMPIEAMVWLRLLIFLCLLLLQLTTRNPVPRSQRRSWCWRGHHRRHHHHRRR